MRLRLIKVVEWFELVGRNRAANELHRLGYSEYAKNLLCKK